MPAQLITVTPSRGDRGQINWELCHRVGQAQTCGNGPEYPAVELPPNSGSHVFVFSIRDPAKLGITFANDPIWIQRGRDSPTQSGIDSKNQIEDVTLTNATTLVLNDKNDNGTPFWMSYRLNFVGPNNQAISLDPDIKNGGGGGGTSWSLLGSVETAAIVIGAAVLLFLIGMWIGRKMGNRSVAKSGTGA